jgi:hypothetical protein
VIVVVGRVSEDSGRPQPAEAISRRIASLGGPVELVTVVPEGPGGDVITARLAAAGVGHAAARRSGAGGLAAGAPELEPADLALALRYLPDITVVILAGGPAGLAATASEAATWSGAFLVSIRTSPSDAWPDGTPEGERAMTLEAPPTDPDGAFAGLVAALAVRLDRGEPAADAWRAVERDLGLDRVSRR